MVWQGFWEVRLHTDTAGDSVEGPGLSKPAAPILVRRASQAVVEDADGYETSVRGVSIKSMRTGQGLGPNRVLAATADHFVATSVDVGFPMLNRTTIEDDRVLVASVRSAAKGARWPGLDLRPGMVVMCSPEAAHIGVNPAGLSFAFAVVKLRVIEEFASSLGRRFRPPPTGDISALAPLPHASAFDDALSSFLAGAAAGEPPLVKRQDDVLHWVAAALSDEHRSWPGTRPLSVDRRRIVHTCIDYAEAIKRVPSVKELCLVVDVSQRTLRDAFSAETGMPPTVFFRQWALNQARRRLRTTNEHSDTVTNVAFDLGFNHLSRFANRYKRLFGEVPSTTLRSRPIALGLPDQVVLGTE